MTGWAHDETEAHTAPRGDCDCCGKSARLAYIWVSSVGDTYACAECRGDDTEDDDDA